jgi:hypothetical protein
MSFCGFTQLSGKYKKRTYISASTVGNPALLVNAIVLMIVGLCFAVALTVMMDGDQPELPWIVFFIFLLISGVLFILWWCSRKMLVSIGLKGAELLAPAGPTFGFVDPTGVTAAILFRPKLGADCHELVEEIDGLAECSVRREALINQRTNSNEKVGSGVTWMERKTKDGEFYYENAKNGNTAWQVNVSQPIYSNELAEVPVTREP